MKKIILPLLLFFSVFTNVKPVKEENVKKISVMTGLVVGAVAGAMAYNDSTYDYYGRRRRNEPTNDTIMSSIAVGSFFGVLSGWIAYLLAKESTPTHKYNKAVEIIEKVNAKWIASKEFESHRAFLNYILSKYSYWPLCSAIKDLNSIRLELVAARALLNAACDESRKHGTNLHICSKSNWLHREIERLIEYVSVRVSVISSWPMYKKEQKKYNRDQKRRAKEARRRQDRWERERDRLERERARREREQFTQHLVGQTHGNVAVNVNL